MHALYSSMTYITTIKYKDIKVLNVYDLLFCCITLQIMKNDTLKLYINRFINHFVSLCFHLQNYRLLVQFTVELLHI